MARKEALLELGEDVFHRVYGLVRDLHGVDASNYGDQEKLVSELDKWVVGVMVV